MSQKTFADLSWDRKDKTTRREKFLAEMSKAIPWKELESLILPVAPSVVPSDVGGRPAYPVSVMLRIYFCQSWYQLSDDAAEDSLYDIESVRRFCIGSASVEHIPDERSIRRFRHLLEEHKLPEKLMQKVTCILSQKDKNQRLCSKRAPVEHPFHIVKCLFGYRKVRYRGLFKNRMHQLTLFMLANLFKEGRQNP